VSLLHDVYYSFLSTCFKKLILCFNILSYTVSAFGLAFFSFTFQALFNSLSCSQISKQVPGISLSIEREGHTHSFCCTEAGSEWVAHHVASLIKKKISSWGKKVNCLFIFWFPVIYCPWFTGKLDSWSHWLPFFYRRSLLKDDLVPIFFMTRHPCNFNSDRLVFALKNLSMQLLCTWHWLAFKFHISSNYVYYLYYNQENKI
jgi:hypothetical protein